MDALVEDIFQRSVLPIALQINGYEALHASAVTMPGGIVAFCGRSHSGKSTLAYGLAQRGYSMWADDAVVFAPAGPGIQTLPLDFTVQMRPASASHFFDETNTIYVSNIETADRNDAPAAGQPLLAVYLLERIVDAKPFPPRTLDLQGSAALTAVMAHAYVASLVNQDRNQAMLAHYFDLVGRVPIRHLRYTSGFDHFAPVIDVLDAALTA